MQFISKPFNRHAKPFDKYDIFGVGLFLCDRYNPKNQYKWPYNFTIRDDCKMPLMSTDLNFRQICELRIEELREQKRDNWTVLWSGGMDSTLMLRLLLNTDIPFSVMLSDSSIQTYPDMYNELLKRKINLLPTTKYLTKAEDLSYIATGPCDNLFYNFANYEENSEIKPNMSIDDFYLAFSRRIQSKSLAKFQIDLVMDSCPFELECYSDLVWWHGFNLRWQTTSIVGSIRLQSGNKFFKRVITNFFDTELFQRWSLSTYKERRVDDYREVKRVIKDYLYDLGDKQYVRTIHKTRGNPWAIGLNKGLKDISAVGELL